MAKGSEQGAGRLSEDGKALIIGAGGGIGSVAVGIGKRLGGHVTGVCSTKDVERVEELGADAVIDRKRSDPLDAESAYDVIFDTPAVHSFGRCAKMLRGGGTLSPHCRMGPWSLAWLVHYSHPSAAASSKSPLGERTSSLSEVG